MYDIFINTLLKIFINYIKATYIELLKVGYGLSAYKENF